MLQSPIRWTVASAYADRFTPDVLDAILSRRLVSREEVKRELQSRRVSFLCLKPDTLPDIYLKEYTISLKKPFRAFVRPNGLHEWRMAHMLRERGIPTITPIAIGTCRSWGIYRRSFFLSEAIQDSITLKEYIERHGPKWHFELLRENRDLIDHFAEFASLLRNAGVVHRDLHLGNVLVQARADGFPQFYLIDLHRVRIRTEQTEREGLSNLALLSAALWGRVPSRTQLHFLRAYCSQLWKDREKITMLRRTIARQVQHVLQRTWSKKVDRCCRENKDFKKIVLGKRRGYAVRDCPEVLLKLMELPDRLFCQSGVRILKDSRTTSSLILVPADAEPLFLKRYNKKGVLHTMKHLFAHSRARRVWQASHALLARGVPTPRPILFLEERRMGIVMRSFFLSHAAAQARDLEVFIADEFGRFEKKMQQAFIKKLARHVRAMHDSGVRHGDLKAKNILITDAGGEAWQIWFVDLDAVVIKKMLSFHERCRDIERLSRSFPTLTHVTLSHRAFFLKHYFAGAKRQAIRKAWQTIQRIGAEKMKRTPPAQ